MQGIKTNPQATSSDRKKKSFQFKNRIRRQHNTNDIAKLFLAIREHRTGNPELNKISEIEGLLTQVENINDIDLNDGGNTPLHVAVSEGHQEIVELLLNVSGIDPNTQNNQGNTPLDIAKQLNKEKIIEILEEHFKKSSGQVKRLSEQEKEVHEKLRKFVEDFVFIYELSLSEYYERLENRKGKPGKWADFVSMITYTGKGGAEGMEMTKVKASSLVIINVLRLAISGIGIKHNRRELKKLIEQLYIFKKDPVKVREELVKSGIEIFQAFESQFVQVKADGSWQRAMTKLAEDAVNRVVDYYRKNTEEEFCASSITEGIILGESKKYKQTFADVPHIKPGHTLKNKNLNSWNTAELFDKAGLVMIKGGGSADKYYRRKDGKSDTSKYGYRLLFKWELKNKIRKFVREYSEENPPRKEYRYVLKSDGEKWESQLLGEINKQDPKLIQERLLSNFKGEINQEAEKNANELENFIDENFNDLSSYIESNQDKVKEVLSELMNQQHRRIANSIAEGRKESKESLKKVEKKLDKIHSLIVAEQQVREPIQFDVKKPVSLFTGREEELIDLHNKVQRSSGKVTVISQITSISGLGGIGKTELARQYIQEYSKDYSNDVIWINAESEVDFIESFTRLAKDKLEVNTKDANGKEKDIKSIVEEVYKFFSNSKALFIFDNAEKSDCLNKFLPLYGLLPDDNVPYVLITSRNREWEKGIEVIHLKELKLEEAIEFVKKGLDIKDKSQDEKIKALVEKLQHFPLAIQQALAYIEGQRITGEFDIDDYLEEYEKKAKDLLKYEAFRGIDNDYTKTTFTTWKITIDKIASDEKYGKLALSILNIISYLAPEKISREVFLGLTESNEEELKSAVRLLIKYSMVSGEQKQSVLSVHRLVQKVTRIALEEKGKSKEVMKETYKLLEANFPYGGVKLEGYIKQQELLPHLETFLSNIDNWLKKKSKDKQKIEEDYLESLLIFMSYGYFNFGNHERQKELLERALPILEKHYGENGFKVAAVLEELSVSYTKLDNYRRAKELLERALSILKNHYGEGHFEVVITLVNLNIIYQILGDYQKAKELLEEALPILEGHYEKDHFAVAKVLVNLSINYRALGGYQRARELLEEALPILEKHHGKKHLQVAIILKDLSTIYENLGDYKKAKEFLERALPILKKCYGKKHFQVAIVLANLSSIYLILPDYENAKNLQKRALSILERQYKVDHFNLDHDELDNSQLALTLEKISKAYTALGNYHRAKELLEKALPFFKKHYGEDHFQVAIILKDLSTIYENLGNYQKAKELLEEALPILKKYYGKKHFQVAIVLANLSSIYLILPDYENAKRLQKSALNILEKQYKVDNFNLDHDELDNFQLALTLEKISKAYIALGNYQIARELLEKGANIFEKSDNDIVLYQVINSDNEEVTRLILEKIKGKDLQNFSKRINAKYATGDTLLICAAQNGKINAVKILLECGVDFNLQNNNGETALHWAAKGRYQEIVQLLLDKQADPNIQDNNGKTPLDLAQEKLGQDRENATCKAITDLLLSVTDKYQYREEQVSVSLEECLVQEGVKEKQRLEDVNFLGKT